MSIEYGGHETSTALALYMQHMHTCSLAVYASIRAHTHTHSLTHILTGILTYTDTPTNKKLPTLPFICK